MTERAEMAVFSIPYREGSVASREVAAIRNWRVRFSSLQAECSKSRSGRNPQLGLLGAAQEV